MCLNTILFYGCIICHIKLLLLDYIHTVNGKSLHTTEYYCIKYIRVCITFFPLLTSVYVDFFLRLYIRNVVFRQHLVPNAIGNGSSVRVYRQYACVW